MGGNKELIRCWPFHLCHESPVILTSGTVSPEKKPSIPWTWTCQPPAPWCSTFLFFINYPVHSVLYSYTKQTKAVAIYLWQSFSFSVSFCSKLKDREAMTRLEGILVDYCILVPWVSFLLSYKNFFKKLKWNKTPPECIALLYAEVLISGRRASRLQQAFLKWYSVLTTPTVEMLI